MRKTIFKFGLLLLAVLLQTGCSSDDDKISPNDENYIETTSIDGKMHFNNYENRWCILSVPKHKMHTIDGGGNFFFPICLSQDFKQEGLKVKVSGDIYYYDHRLNHDGTIAVIENWNYFTIKILNISKID